MPSPSRRRASFGWRGAAAAALLAVIVAGLGVLRVWPPLAVVMSGSMTPTIKTGDMVVLMHLHRPARVGEVVEVPVPDDARARYGYPPVVIHRVFRITGGQIRTKGDARPAADPFTVPQTAVEAKVVADIPAGGRILSFFHSGPGLLWLLFGAALFFGLPLLDRLRDARGREAEATADLRDQLAAVSAGLAHLQTEQEHSRQAADETLAQLDRLTRLVAGTLGQEPSAPDGDVPAPEATPGETAASPDGESATSAPASADSASTCGTATEPMAASASEPSFDPVPDSVDAQGSATATAPEREVRSAVESHLAAVAQPAPPAETVIIDRESAPATEPPHEAQAAFEPQPEAAIQPGPAIQPETAGERRPAARPGVATGAPAEPVPAARPAEGRGQASAAQPVPAAQVAIGESARGIASGRLCVSLPGRADTSRGTAAARTMTCSSGLVARVSATAGPALTSAPPLPALGRWDALPAATALDRGGWAAPPVLLRSARFQRPGRLIAASLAQPSPVA